MTQVAALLRPRDSEIIQRTKSKTAYVKLVDYDRIGRDNNINIKVFTSSVTRDLVRVKVSVV